MAWSRSSRILAPTLAVLSLASALYLGEPLRRFFVGQGEPPSSVTVALRTFYDVPVILASAALGELDEWGTEQMWVAVLFPLVLLQNLILWLLVRLALGRHAAR
jgi:hypothetical protein